MYWCTFLFLHFFRVLMQRCSPIPVVIMYIFVCKFFQGTDATVLPNAIYNDVQFCLYIFSGYQCHGAPLGLQKMHGKGTNRHMDRHRDNYTKSAQWADLVKKITSVLLSRVLPYPGYIFIFLFFSSSYK